jgi:hypothetical protein
VCGQPYRGFESHSLRQTVTRMSYAAKIELSEPVIGQIREYGLQIAKILVTRLDEGLFSPYAVKLGSAEYCYRAEAIAQTAIMNVLNGEGSEIWNRDNLPPAILDNWGRQHYNIRSDHYRLTSWWRHYIWGRAARLP